ncbi:MAG TPA: bifunctional [glutamate--ammonia ligase]-adenylyl-L-tyrosine phosphorylase/[glutamate--ammonia-ligase] adenylyltransferase, partial [Woeseiaceae bacterium]
VNSSAGKELQGTIRVLPEPLRAPLTLWVKRFMECHLAGLEWLTDNHEARLNLMRLVACSEFAGSAMIRDWEWFASAARHGRLVGPPDTSLSLLAKGDAGADATKRRLRQFRNRKLLHILWRDMAGSASVAETLASLSELADSLIVATTQHAEAELQGRFGAARDEEGRELRLLVLAMGKLGGRELNFSSDVDLIFLFPGDGETDGKRRLSAQEYFTRLSRIIVALLDEVTPDGFVYRVDTRLRPFGDSGPPVVSFGALESYLLRHGRGWERYAYVKARVVETNSDRHVTAELMEQVITPFVYRRYLDYGVFESLREMKALIAAEARKRELARNIKLGPGGIREIEFIVQSLQLVRGGSDRRLKTPALRDALQHLGRTAAIGAADAASLIDAYDFLRRLENALQAIRDQQLHDLPANVTDRARLALALRYRDWPALADDLERHRQTVSSQFAAVAFRGGDGAAPSDLNCAVTAMWSSVADAEEWTAALQSLGYAESQDMAATIVAFAGSASVCQIGKTGGGRLRRFMPALLAALKGKQRPAIVLQRVLGIVEQILRRSAYVALLNENPVVLERLVGLCETSAWLAEEIGRYPLLLDELLDPRLYTAPLKGEDMLRDLARRLDSLAATDSEQQIEVLAQFQRAALFRIAVADVSGHLPIMKVSDRLTELAEIVLNKALAIAWADLTALHGQPVVNTSRGSRHAGFGVIGYGKFGGMELGYRSDLDLVFLHDAPAGGHSTEGDRPLELSMFLVRLVRRLVHFLTTQTGSGALYQVDTRLRPSGRSGLLVTSIEAFERYQEENAWTWEHQALLRSRPVAGDASVAREFERVRAETLKHRVRRDRLLDDVREMRARMRSQLDKSDGERFDLKQGEGGVGDIEFLVQYLVLRNADRHPAVIHYPDNIRQLGTLGAAGCLGEAEVARLQEIYKAYRLRLHRLALDEKAPLAGSSDFSDERQFVVSMWNRYLQ